MTAATPYVTAAEFAAHPTYLDIQALRSGIMDPEAQTAELTNILLMASAWADNECNQRLGAHRVDLSTQGRIDRDGNLVVFPSDRPVLSVAAVSYGSTLSRLAYSTAPAARVDKNQTIVIPLSRVSTRGRVWVDITYTAGWVSTLLAEPAFDGATSLTVLDATGIMPGASYRLWEPGVEETVTVSPAWTPPDTLAPGTPVSVPLTAPTAHVHAEDAGWSGMPADMRLAVVNYTVAQLMRPDTAAEDSFPDTSLASGTRQQDSRKDGSGLVREAARILSGYARRM